MEGGSHGTGWSPVQQPVMEGFDAPAELDYTQASYIVGRTSTYLELIVRLDGHERQLPSNLGRRR
jgi:hypothetical protein